MKNFIKNHQQEKEKASHETEDSCKYKTNKGLI